MIPQRIHNFINPNVDFHRPICVAVLGAGWFGRGLVGELSRQDRFRPSVVFSRKIEAASAAFIKAGIPQDRIHVLTGHERGEERRILYYACDDWQKIFEHRFVDVVFDATGDILFGAQVAVECFKQGIPFVTISSELDATIGYCLNTMARSQGCVYTNSDGDQPGVLGRLIHDVSAMGFEIAVAGNCKGFLDAHKTPDDIKPWVQPGHNPRMVTAFTDGTKQGLELAVVANAFGLNPDRRGMHGPTVTKNTLVDTFSRLMSQEGIVDFVLGINGVDQGGGVFVIGKRTGETVASDMEYLKKGKGPYYLFFKDEHLCYFESPRTIAEAVEDRHAAIAPQGLSADVITMAKRDIKAGEQIDGIGGYSVYGQIESYAVARSERLLPIGLSQFARAKKDISCDTPVSYDMVEFEEDNLVLQLRKLQDRGPLLNRIDRPSWRIR